MTWSIRFDTIARCSACVRRCSACVRRTSCLPSFAAAAASAAKLPPAVANPHQSYLYVAEALEESDIDPNPLSGKP